VFSMFLTQSRSSIVILTIILSLVLLQFKFKKYDRVKKVIILGLFFIVTYFLINNLNNFTERFQVNEDFDNGRIEALLIGITQIKESIFGIGIGFTSDNIFGQSSHNFIIHTLAEAGIFMTPFLIIIFAFLFHKIFISFIYSFRYNIYLISGLFSVY